MDGLLAPASCSWLNNTQLHDEALSRRLMNRNFDFLQALFEPVNDMQGWIIRQGHFGLEHKTNTPKTPLVLMHRQRRHRVSSLMDWDRSLSRRSGSTLPDQKPKFQGTGTEFHLWDVLPPRRVDRCKGDVKQGQNVDVHLCLKQYISAFQSWNCHTPHPPYLVWSIWQTSLLRLNATLLHRSLVWHRRGRRI